MVFTKKEKKNGVPKHDWIFPNFIYYNKKKKANEAVLERGII